MFLPKDRHHVPKALCFKFYVKHEMMDKVKKVAGSKQQTMLCAACVECTLRNESLLDFVMSHNLLNVPVLM